MRQLSVPRGCGSPTRGRCSRPGRLPCGTIRTLDEVAGKQALAGFGLPVPRGALVAPREAAAVAAELGFPVVVKAVSASLAHKTEAGAVWLNLSDGAAVDAAVRAMAALSDRFLVERMAQDVVAEIIVGVRATRSSA